MEIKGKVIVKPASESGTSARGPWKKAYVVVRYEDGQYPKDILLSSMRRADDLERLYVGQEAKFKFDARARQGQSGKWYCDLECWSVEPTQVSAPASEYNGGPI